MLFANFLKKDLMNNSNEKIEEVFKGIAASPGIVFGEVYFFTKHTPRIEEKNISSQNIENEITKFEHAIKRSEVELLKIQTLTEQKIGKSNANIFEAQILILNDAILFKTICELIKRTKKNAEYIVNLEITKYQQLMLSSADEYMRERAHDVEDVKNRLIRNIQQEKLISRFKNNTIVMSESLTPADTVLFSRNNILGVITETGGTTSHAALIARSLRIPAVLGAKGICNSIKNSDEIILDGNRGVIILNPTKETKKNYHARQKEFEKFERRLEKLRDLPAVTLDDFEIGLSSNIEFVEEIDYIHSQGSHGIGLYRSEGVLIGQDIIPSEEEQFNAYKAIADKTFPFSVIMRTFDIGGDKVVDEHVKEENPFLGFRGVRVSLASEKFFTTQLRAILRASTRKNISILLPMISSLEEVRESKRILEKTKDDLKNENIPFDEKIKIGVMIEVPSAALLAREISAEVDFLSIGTNDLVQYLLAVDRGNENIGNIYQELHPAVLRTIHFVISEAHKAGKKVGICGELGANPLATLPLLGFGLDEFSVNPAMLPEVKKIIRSITMQDAKRVALKVLELSDTNDIKNYLKEELHKVVPDIPIND